MRDAGWYQFWHAELNRMLFDGRLEPCVMCVSSCTGDLRAEFVPSTNPYLMSIYDEPEEADADALTVLLHEMCHEYIDQNDLVNDEHGPMFQSVARDHGMGGIGYSLADETRDRLEKRLSSFDNIQSIGASRMEHV